MPAHAGTPPRPCLDCRRRAWVAGHRVWRTRARQAHGPGRSPTGAVGRSTSDAACARGASAVRRSGRRCARPQRADLDGGQHRQSDDRQQGDVGQADEGGGQAMAMRLKVCRRAACRIRALAAKLPSSTRPAAGSATMKSRPMNGAPASMTRVFRPLVRVVLSSASSRVVCSVLMMCSVRVCKRCRVRTRTCMERASGHSRTENTVGSSTCAEFIAVNPRRAGRTGR